MRDATSLSSLLVGFEVTFEHTGRQFVALRQTL
jgi:hypothetical protein